MRLTGNLRKMHTRQGDNVHYFLTLGDEEVDMNNLLGKLIHLEFKGEIHCIRCGRVTRTSFAQGFCYPCFISAPETEECVMRPELCKAHLGEARDMSYARDHCLIDHYVYLASSGGLKVGVTRHTQVPVRWIDQGASRAIRIAKTPNRYIAGCIEVALKNIFRDKTNWRDMLMNLERYPVDLVGEKKKALEYLHPDYRQYAWPEDDITGLRYPVLEYPSKVTSVNFDKTPSVSGILEGIRGQYLIFSGGNVINIRKHGGYLVELTGEG